MIHRIEESWGVKLSVAPFAHSGGLKAMMRIDADIHKPTGKRGPEIKVFFHSTAYGGKYISASNARIWGTALNVLVAAAEKVAEEMRPKKKRTTKKAKKSN